MANKVQMLNKIQRNLEQMGLTPVRASTNRITIGNLIVRYEDASILSPMGGVSAAAAPFLGIGVANPGVLSLSGLLDADAAIVDLLVTATDLKVFHACSAFANDLVIRAGDTASAALDVGAGAELARLQGHADLLGLGQ